jgi:putative transposase
LLKAVKGVDPINFAPALLDGNTQGGARCDVSPMAWRFFMTLIRDAAPDWPLISAWRHVRDVAEIEGWDWPSFPTVWRRWNELPEAQRLEAREGKRAAVKALALPALRDKTSISALEWVSLDGRTQDFWVVTEEGKVVRPVMIILVDVASNKVLDFELAPSENAVATVRLIRRTCETYGTFDRLYTDNGSAFAGHLVAGGNPHKFRNSAGVDSLQPFGICKILGIKLHFALPENAQTKIAERTYASLSRVIDDGPEFKGAHAGHKPGAIPDAKVTPVPIDKAMAVLKREVKRYNAETGRRSQGANGRSYDQVFDDQMLHRTHRKPSVRQLYLSGLVWKPVAVDRWGRVTVNGWTYGGHSTQDALLRFHGRDKRILLGRDPYDFSAPAIAFDHEGHLICEGIEPVARGKYGSVDGIRDAARNRKAAREAVKAAETANDYLQDAEYARIQSILNAKWDAVQDVTPQGNGVLAPEFKSPLRDKAKAKPEEIQAVPAEFMKNFDQGVASLLKERSKSA